MEISKILKKRREELGLKIKDIANELGVAESTYREWENGRKIQGEPYLKLSVALNISVSELLGLEQSEILKCIICDINDLENHIKIIRSNVMRLI